MSDAHFLRLAFRLARRGYGATSPNPMVGAVLVKGGKVIGCGWHRQAGRPHAEIEALHDAQKRGHNPRGAALYVTLEPCCTHGRTPPCTDAIIAAGIKQVIVGTVDPNPKHAGRAFRILRRAGIAVIRWGDSPDAPCFGSRERSPHQKLADDCMRLNKVFNHWIVHRTPFVTVKAAMTLDGKIATAGGESKWITGEQARAHGMKLRQGSDAILVGIHTILADDPSLTVRTKMEAGGWKMAKPIRRIVLDSMARTPLNSRIVTDEYATLTTLIVTPGAPKNRLAALAKRVKICVAPSDRSKNQRTSSRIDLPWLLKRLGSENVTSLLVEGGGEVNASFLLGGLAQRVTFFYAPKILGGRNSRKAVAGGGVMNLNEIIQLRDIQWQKFGSDLLLVANVES